MSRPKEGKKVKEAVVLTDAEREAQKKISDEKKRRKALRNEVTHKLRFVILERDEYTCQYCGKSPTNCPGTQLEIDHVIPIDAGGDNDLENLKTACFECNEGKKNIRLKPPQEPDREWKLNKEAIFEVAKTNDFEKFKAFLVDKDREEERQWLFEYNYRAGRTFCLANCEECVISGTWWFKGCIQKLNRYAHDGMDAAMEVVSRDKGAVVNIDDVVAIVGRPANGELIPIKGSKYDKMKCDFCYGAMRCPLYKVGATCAFNFRSDVDFSDAKTAMPILANEQAERIMRGLTFEKSDGGAIDKNVSNEIMLFMRLMKEMAELNQPTASIKIEGTGTGVEGVGIVKQLVAGLIGDGEEKSEEEVEVEVVDDAEVVEEKVES